MMAFPFEFRAEDYATITGQQQPNGYFTRTQVSNEMAAGLGQNLKRAFLEAEKNAKEYSVDGGCEMGPLMAMVLQKIPRC